MAWPVASQDVVWDSPSSDAKGSMPLGNGDIGLNVWVEASGELVLLIAKNDSFDEFNRLLKIGRIRVRTTPALFHPGMTFSQALRLADGAIEIKSDGTSIRVWVDANQPVAQVDLTSASPVEVRVLADNWRTKNRALRNEGPGMGSAWGNWPDKMRVNADSVLPKRTDQIGWCHHNVESQWKKNLELTALGAEVAKGQDPVLNRSFGALLRATGTTAVSDTELKTAGLTNSFTLRILTTTGFFDSPQDWERSANSRLDSIEKLTDADRFTAHKAWWRTFWNRSWVQIDTGPSAESVTRAYTLQRFVTACSGHGGLPIKFNRSLFTVEGRDPDFRAWGGGYWWQNTRLPYWGMLYAGDYEMMTPLFAMYLKALPLREAAAKKHYNHAGGFFPETMYFWGNYLDDANYGLDRRGKPDGMCDNTFIRRYWQSGLELRLAPRTHNQTLISAKTSATRIFPQALLLAVSLVCAAEPHRQTLNLGSIWQVAEGKWAWLFKR